MYICVIRQAWIYRIKLFSSCKRNWVTEQHLVQWSPNTACRQMPVLTKWLVTKTNKQEVQRECFFSHYFLTWKKYKINNIKSTSIEKC